MHLFLRKIFWAWVSCLSPTIIFEKDYPFFRLSPRFKTWNEFKSFHRKIPANFLLRAEHWAMNGNNLIRIPCSIKDEHEFVLVHVSYGLRKDDPLSLIKLIGSEGENVYTVTSMKIWFFCLFYFKLLYSCINHPEASH